MTQPYNRNQGGHSSQQRRGDQSQDRSNNEAQQLTPSEDAKRAAEFIQSGKSDSFVGAAENMAKALRKVDTNQLRNFYESVVEIQMRLGDEPNNSMLVVDARSLATKVAWAAAKLEGNVDGRGDDDKTLRKRAMRQFHIDIKEIIAALFSGLTEERVDAQRYERFKSLIEAIVVYHKASKEKII